MFLNKPKAPVKTSDPVTMSQIAAAHASPGVKLIAGGCVVAATGIILGFGYFHFRDNPVKEAAAATPSVQTLPAKLNIPYLPPEPAPAPPTPPVQAQQTAYPPGMNDQAPQQQQQQFAPQQAGSGEAQQAAVVQKTAAEAARARRFSAGFGNEVVQQRAAPPPVTPGEEAAPVQPSAPSAQPAPAAPIALSGLAAMLVPTSTPGVQASYLTNQHTTLLKGTPITCTLLTAISTEQAGFTSCLTDYPVKSMDGSTVVMARGTRVEGEYARGMAHGAKAVFVLWTRAITQEGVAVPLMSPGTDPLGRSGLAGEVDSKWKDRYLGAFVFSLLQDGVAVATRSGSSGGNTQINLGNTQATGTTAAGEILRQNSDVMPSMAMKQGTSVGITVAQDIDLSRVYGMKLKGSK